MTTALERFLALRRRVIEDGPGGDAAGLCLILSDAMDTAIAEMAAPHAGDVAFVAVGGYGRREQCIHSDVDLMILHEGKLPKAVTQDVLYPLWDAGLSVGHSVRTKSQTLAAARDSLETRCALLTARLITGPYDHFTATWAALADLDRPRPIRSLLAEEIRERRRAEPYQLLDPDLKTGRGGLRTFQALEWQRISGRRFPQPSPEEQQARSTLLGVRNAIHAVRTKKVDVYDRELQPRIAAWLGRDRDSVSTSVYLAMRTGDRLALEEWPEIAHEQTDRISATGRRVVQAIRSRFGPPSQLTSAAQPALQIAAEALTRNSGPIFTDPEHHQLTAAPAHDWTHHDRTVLVQILAAGERGRDVFAALDRHGWVDAALPELGHLRGLPQHAPFHAHPADTHMWRAADEMLALVDGRTEDPWAVAIADELGATDQLLLAAFLHDVGKGLGTSDHSVSGAELTEAFCRRVGYGPATTATLSRAVRHHLFLANVASRRDIEDRDVIAEVADRTGDLRFLQTLYLLTVADLRATGPGMHAPWRLGMLRRLFARVSEAVGTDVDIDVLSDDTRVAGLVTRPHPDLEDIDIKEHLAAMPEDYLSAYADGEIIEHARLASPVPGSGEAKLDVRPGTMDRVTIVGRDIPGFASVATGVLALHNLSVVNARFNTRSDGVAIDTFDVIDALGSDNVEAARWDRVDQDLSAALGGELDLEQRLVAKSRTYRSPERPAAYPSVRAFAAGRRTGVEVRTNDRIGLLHDLLEALHSLDLDLQLARIDTRGYEAIDTFYVRDDEGRPLDEARIAQVEARLLGVIAG